MSETITPILSAAVDCLGAGLCVLPANLREKRVALPSWKEYQQRLPTEGELHAWFANGRDALCIIAGEVSGHLEMIDFDVAGELYPPWAELVEERRSGLLERLVRERSQGGGRHICYRTETTVPGSMKLAQRQVECPDGEPVTIAGKQHVPRRVGDRWVITVTLIETRGEGGLFLCAPSPRYELEHGSFHDLPVIQADERLLLIECARALDELPPDPEEMPDSTGSPPTSRPGDEFNRRGDIAGLLETHDWTLVRPGPNQYWRRPGKENGWSATFNGSVFYCFSSNAPPFEMNRGYSPFAVYALLKHDGDYSAAATTLTRQGYGTDADDTEGVDLSGMLAPAPEENVPEHPDPGPVPESLLRVPGLIEELMEYTLDTAPYPNLVLAFCGALILQAFLAGRKVRDDLNIRTNLYLLGLASSGVGKEHPRKVNQQVLLGLGLQDCLGDAFASGEGIEDRLYAQPSLLFQTDEIDKVLKSIKRGTQSRWDKIVEMLLKLFTASDSLYPCRVKADQEHRVIDQPSLCIFGTAIPTHYYGALSEDLLTNGLFARMLILEAGERADGQAPPGRPLPKRVLDAARAWATMQPGSGNIAGEHPQPQIVPATADARQLLVDCQQETDALYREQEEEMARAVWARAHEKTRRLALIYACSRDHEDLLVTAEAVEWAWELVEHLSHRMCYMADVHAFETDHEERLQEFLEFFREHQGEWVPLWKIGRKFRKLDNKTRDAVLEALVDSRFIEPGHSNADGPGATGRRYRLRAGGER